MDAKKPSVWVGIGIIVGSIIGIATDNAGLWIALGLAVGAGIGASRKKPS